MKISVSNDITYNFKPVDIKNERSLVEKITSTYWSQGIFKNGHRSLDNFISADVIALDIDNKEGEEIKIDKAKELFAEYTNYILPTPNHQKAKDGLVKDRYRVIIPFDKTITDKDEYYGTFDFLYNKFNFVDKSCKDPSRYWKPSSKLFSLNQGKLITPIKRIKEQLAQPEPNGLKGHLTKATLDFLFNGTHVNWNSRLHEAALDFRSQGYSKEETEYYLELLAARKDLGNLGHLDSTDLRTIKSAFEGEIYHQVRGAVSSFNFKKVGEIVNTASSIEWLVDGLLSVGGLSLIAGPPKSGKSTIIRQLSGCIAKGSDFLDRKVKQGLVFYLALEEQAEVMSEQLKKQGVTDKDAFYIHAGPVMVDDKRESISTLVKQQRPSLLVIDTMVLFVGAEDMNNYNEMYSILTFFRELARETGTHITFVHHQNKSKDGGTSSIMGSSAIHGSVDNAILFNNYGGKRRIETSQRGGKPFLNTRLIYNADTQTYSIDYNNPEF